MVIIYILLLVLGMALLVKGGDILVDGSSSLARRFNVSELAIGLTVVAFGTSAPELVVSLSAALGAHPEIALGNVIGSNNFNLFFILGATGLIAPLAVQRNSVRFEIPFSLFAALIMFLLANFTFPFGDEKDMLTRIDGVIFLLFFVLFLFYLFKSMKNGKTADETAADAKTFTLLKSILFIVFGLVFLVVGGKIVVDSAVFLADKLGISEKVIGLTIVAIGTSLPELVTSIAAVLKKSDDIAIGNIIGSNIFNIFLILGASAVVRPMEYSPIFNRDIYFLFFGTILLILAMFTGKRRTLDRWESAVLLLLYVGYVVYLIMRNE